MRISLIVAVAPGGVIGLRNGMPWRLPADLKRFKRLTMGHHLIVGRKTWEAIGRPLRGRRMVVVSRGDLELPEACRSARSVEEALETAAAAGEDEAFIGGGGEIYKQTLGRADRLYLTRIHAEFKGDTYFPEIAGDEWSLTSLETRPADERNETAVTFEVYDRIHAAADPTEPTGPQPAG